MSSVIDRLRKRSCRPVEVNGEKFYVRSLTSAEIRQSESVSDATAKADFMLGTMLVDSDGSRVFQRGSDESVPAFAERMKSELADVEESVKVALLSELMKASKVPSPETLAKN